MACPASSGGGRGIIGPARPVRGDLSSGAGCCCPLLYSYVGRGGGAWPVQRPAAAGCDLLPARHHRAAHGKAAHGKRATKKEVNAARAVSTSFSRQIFGRLESPAAGAAVVHVGRLESVALHAGGASVHDIPLYTLPRIDGGGADFCAVLFCRSDRYAVLSSIVRNICPLLGGGSRHFVTPFF